MVIMLSPPYEKGKGNRAFTKTGLKVIFHFLFNENIVNQTYREIASLANVGLGNINYVINGLKELGFLIKLDKTNYKLRNKKELLNKWIDAYDERLKPAIKVGTFRFLKQDDFTNWKMIPLRPLAGSALPHHPVNIQCCGMVRLLLLGLVTAGVDSFIRSCISNRQQCH